jgi:hypothetical protein
MPSTAGKRKRGMFTVPGAMKPVLGAMPGWIEWGWRAFWQSIRR